MSTITDVAREAGVSVATVSRVINGSGFVAPETKQRVQEAIERLAYAPNVYSRNLRRQESRMILVLLPDFAGSSTEWKNAPARTDMAC